MRKNLSISLVLCVLLSLLSPIVYAADSWSGWTLTNEAVIRDGKAYVRASNGSISQARLNRTNNTKFDIEVVFAINAYGTHNGFQILTGSNRALMYVYENRIDYCAADFNITNKLSSIPYNIGFEKHKYRVVGNGKNCDLYIDDYFVTDFTIESNTGNACIYFWTQNVSGQTAEIVVESYKDNGASVDISSSNNTNAEKNEAPVAFRYDFEDGEDVSDWDLQGTWEVKDGYLQSNNTTSSSHVAKRITAFADDYVLELRVRWLSWGSIAGINLRDGEHEVAMEPYEYLFRCRNRLGLVAKTGLNLGNDWHVIRAETYNNGTDVMIFLDGELIHDNTTSDRIETEKYIGVSTAGIAEDACWMQVDWLSFEPKSNSEFGIKTPMQFAEYIEGQDISLSANVKDTANIPYVEYKMNGKPVATGYAPAYNAMLQNVNAGNYSLSAEYGDNKSIDVSFKVLPAVTGDIDVDGRTVSLSGYDKNNRISYVEYLIDGISAGKSQKAPYSMELPELSAEAHILTAVCYDSNDVILYEAAKKLLDLSYSNGVSVNFANAVTYHVMGTTGSASVEIDNGNHKLYLNHNKDSVSYLTNEGVKTYSAGLGDWQILTDAYTAEVYRNGQFAFAYIMPKTGEVNSSVNEQGLHIEGFHISIPESRGNYFVKRNVTDKSAIYRLSEIGTYHNLDFTAGKNDSAELAVSDGYFRTSLEIENGKLYTFTTDTDSSVPYRMEIADVPAADDEVYYRLETGAGMTRLYADGKWISSFRSVRSAGKGGVGINVTGGDGLNYVAVSDNSDLYIYNDDFTGKAEFESGDYWREENVSSYVDKTEGVMTLNAQKSSKAVSELHVSAQEAEVSCEVEIKECTGGFWFIFNHGAENIYSKAGYNFETGNFEITNNLVNDVETVTAEGKLPIGEKVKLSLKIHNTPQGKEAVLYLNGKVAIAQSATLENRGRIGFMINKGVVYVHNFAYAGDSKPVLSVTEQLIDNTNATYDMYEVEDELVLMNAGRKIRSTDGFKTWSVETLSSNTYASDNIVRLKSGALVSISRIAVDGGYIFQSNISYDDGQSWEKQSNLMDVPKEGRNNVNNRIIQGESGRLYYASGEDSNEAYGGVRVYYSDDEGWTWTPSEVELSSETTGFSVQEGKVIELPSGEVQMYFRNEAGMLLYFVSHDRGATWDLMPHRTPFFSTLNCYNIEYDPYEENVLYIAWGYDNAFSDGRNQSRRTRIALARSYDGGETWGYLGTAFEFDMNTFFLQRGNDYTMMNACVNVGRDYVVVNAYGRHDLETAWTNRVVVMDKDKLRDTGRFEQVHFFYPGFIDITRFVSEQKLERTMAVDKTTNRMLINGRVVENGSVDGKIFAGHAAAFVGAKISYGDTGEIIFTSNNGAEVKFGRDVVSDIGGKLFISVEAFTEKYALYLYEEDDVCLISAYDSWSQDQVRAFRYGLNLFSENTGRKVK